MDKNVLSEEEQSISNKSISNIDPVRPMDNIDDALSQLKKISKRLQKLSSILILFTFSSLLFYIGSFLKFYPFSRLSLEVRQIAPVYMLITIILGVLAFDRNRKNGDAYFDEISNELHDIPPSESEGFKNMSLKARLIMREYSSSADLPLIPGKYGPLLILLFNLVQTALFVYFIHHGI